MTSQSALREHHDSETLVRHKGKEVRHVREEQSIIESVILS